MRREPVNVDEIRRLKYGVKTAKRKNCDKMTRSAAIAGE